MSRPLRTDLTPDALEYAIWNRSRDQWDLSQLVHHSDKGAQYLANRYTECLAESGIEGSVGSAGDSYDNAAAKALNKLCKEALIWRRSPWRGSSTSSWRPSNEPTGTTTHACTATAKISRLPSSKPALLR